MVVLRAIYAALLDCDICPTHQAGMPPIGTYDNHQC